MKRRFQGGAAATAFPGDWVVGSGRPDVSQVASQARSKPVKPIFGLPGTAGSPIANQKSKIKNQKLEIGWERTLEDEA